MVKTIYNKTYRMTNTRWIVGNGENMQLWFDNWMGSSLATMLKLSTHLFPHLKATLAFVITDGKWDIPRIILDFPLVAAQIMQVTLPVSPLLDKCAWIHSPDGELSSKLAFQFLNPVPPNLDWATDIWRPCIPPSHSLIFWRFMLSKLPTDENLQLRGCTLVSMCPLCYNHADSSTHLFLECAFSQTIWHWLDTKLQRPIPLAAPTSLLSCIPQRCSSQLRDVLVAAIVHSVHAIWLARNVVRFNATSVTIHATMAKITSMIAMSGAISKGYCLRSDVVILENQFVSPLHRRVWDIIPVVWKPPSSPWVKANTGGSVRNLMAACGGIFRDSHNTFFVGFASNLGRVYVFEAEIMGLMVAMEYASSNRWTRLWLESDSSSAVQAFHKPSLIPVCLRNRWHNCTHNGMFIICSHIFREGNVCANGLAALGHDLNDTTWFTLLSPSLGPDFSRDRNELPNFRFS